MISVFDLFSIGIGPSSSHTVGPMRAARRFAHALADAGLLDATAAVRVDLHGSLGATGRGHGTPKAVLLGLEGAAPETVDPDEAQSRAAAIRAGARVRLLGGREVGFAIEEYVRRLPFHANGMRFTALGADGAELLRRTWYSVGGGFIVEEGGAPTAGPPEPYPFANAAELLAHTGPDRPVSAVVLANETARLPEREVRARLLEIWAAMQECVARGCVGVAELVRREAAPRAGHRSRLRSSARAAAPEPGARASSRSRDRTAAPQAGRAVREPRL